MSHKTIDIFVHAHSWHDICHSWHDIISQIQIGETFPPFEHNIVCSFFLGSKMQSLHDVIWKYVALLYLWCQLCSSCGKRFTISTDEYKNELCAQDAPSYRVTIDSAHIGGICIPARVLCGWECARTPNCTSYNFKSAGSVCELFVIRPILYSAAVGCCNFIQVSAKLMKHFGGNVRTQIEFCEQHPKGNIE